MATRIEVTRVQVEESEVKVFVNNKELEDIKGIKPEGRMLADSDNTAFIYILDVNDDFIYVSFQETVWSDLNKTLSNHLPLFLQIDDDTRIPLIQFEEELQYFISNIKENSNYGEKMVQAVSKAFSN